MTAAPYSEFAGIIRGIIAVTDVVTLRAVDSNLFAVGEQAYVIAGTLRLEWDPTSVDADNGVSVVKPDDIGGGAPGRWLTSKLFGDASAGQSITGMVLSHSWGLYYWTDGFRTALQNKLREKGLGIRWIGTQFNQNAVLTRAPGPDDQTNWMPHGWHEGHSGATMASTDAALNGYLAAEPAGAGVPTLCVIVLGTNDFAVYGSQIHTGATTQGAALAAMTVSMTSIVNKLVAAGTKYIFICDGAHIFPPPLEVYQTEANALADAWNAALPALAASLKVNTILGLQNLTQADMMTNTGTHPNRRADNQIGMLIADAVAPFAPTLSDPVPRRVLKSAPMQSAMHLRYITDQITMGFLAGMKPPGANSFAVFQDFAPTSLQRGGHLVWGYGNADIASIKVNGDTFECWLGGAPVLTGIPADLDKYQRLAFWCDAPTGWVMFAINGVVVSAAKSSWNIVGNLTTYWGSNGASNAAIGCYRRFSMHQGAALPSFANAVKAIEEDFWKSSRCPGMTADCPMDENGGAPVERITSTAGAIIGAWESPGERPTWTDEDTPDTHANEGIYYYEVGPYSSVDFYEFNGGLGLTAAAGTAITVIRRGENTQDGLTQNILGCANFPWTAGAPLALNSTAGTDEYLPNGIGLTLAPVATMPRDTAIGTIRVITQVQGAGTGLANVYIDGEPGTPGDTTGYSEAGCKTAVGVRPVTHSEPLFGATVIGMFTTTTSLTSTEIARFMNDIARVGPERALLALSGYPGASIWLARTAGASWAPVVGAGPTFTRSGTLPVHSRRMLDGSSMPQPRGGVVQVGSASIALTNYVAVGTAPALTGEVRLSNGGAVIGRSTIATDISAVTVEGDNSVTIGDAVDAAYIAMKSVAGTAIYKGASQLASLGLAAGDFIAMGSSLTNISTTGKLRFPHNTLIMTGLRSAGGADRNIISWGVVGIDSLTFGDVNNAATYLYGQQLVYNNGTNMLSIAGGAGDFIAFGASPSSVGQIRLSHANRIMGERSAPGLDRTLIDWGVTLADTLVIGDFNVGAYLMASSLILVGAAGSTIGTISTTGLALAEGVTWGLTQSIRTSDNLTHDLTISTQSAFAGAAGANRNAASLVINLGAIAVGGTRGAVIYKDNSTEFFRIAYDAGNAAARLTSTSYSFALEGYGGDIALLAKSGNGLTLWDQLGLILSANSSGFAFAETRAMPIKIAARTSDNPTFTLTFKGQDANAGATLTNRNGGAIDVTPGLAVGAGTPGPLTLYVGSVGGATKALSCESISGVTAAILWSAMVWDKAAPFPGFTQNTPTADVGTINMEIGAQAAFSGASGANQNGATLKLHGGARTGGSAANHGGVQIGTGGLSKVIEILDTNNVAKIGVFNTTPQVQQTMGVSTAGGIYGATEQTMLQKVWDVLRTFGWGT